MPRALRFLLVCILSGFAHAQYGFGDQRMEMERQPANARQFSTGPWKKQERASGERDALRSSARYLLAV